MFRLRNDSTCLARDTDISREYGLAGGERLDDHEPVAFVCRWHENKVGHFVICCCVLRALKKHSVHYVHGAGKRFEHRSLAAIADDDQTCVWGRALCK